jgi:hypothetical protein
MFGSLKALRSPALGAVFALSFGMFAGPQANAHTISVGSYNAGLAGSVDIVLGTYSHGVPIVQGSIQLIAGPGSLPPIQSFSSVLTDKPLYLSDGVNNFYADATSGTYGTLSADSFNQETNTVGLGPVTDWMVASFTGLTAGIYTYQLTGMTSQNWTNINSFTDNWTGTLEIPEESVSVAVSEPGMPAILGLGLVGLGFARRKKKTA